MYSLAGKGLTKNNLFSKVQRNSIIDKAEVTVTDNFDFQVTGSHQGLQPVVSLLAATHACPPMSRLSCDSECDLDYL